MYRTLASAIVTAALLSTAAAQNATPIPPPSPNLLVSYSYWPSQYIQWIAGGELPYSMFEFDVDSSGKAPLYHAVLTAADGTRTHYSNTAALAAAYKATGEASYKAAIAFDTDDTGKPGSTSTARFTTQDGKSVEFRFVQGSDISEQGSGLTPLPKTPVPVFAYREQGAVAGEGTVLKVGDAVSTAEVWKEISHPPQFVAYRGAVTSGAHMLVFGKGAEIWKIVKAPATLATGSAWELDGDTGNHRTLTVERTDGTHATIDLADRFRPTTRVTLDATRTPAGWTVDCIRYSPVKEGDKHYVTLLFTHASATAGTLQITAGKKAKIATALLETGSVAGGETATVKFTTPAWAADKPVTEQATESADTATLVAK